MRMIESIKCLLVGSLIIIFKGNYMLCKALYRVSEMLFSSGKYEVSIQAACRDEVLCYA